MNKQDLIRKNIELPKSPKEQPTNSLDYNFNSVDFLHDKPCIVMTIVIWIVVVATIIIYKILKG